MHAHPDPDIARRAIREFAENLRSRLWLRMGFYLAAIALGTIFAPLAWAAACAVAIVLTHSVEGRAVGALLAAGDAEIERQWRRLAWAYLASGGAVGFVVAVLWLATAPAQNVFPLSVLFIAALDIVVTSH